MSHAKTPTVSSASPAVAEGLLAEARGLTIPSRFSGPPDSGNGGYVSGRIAAYLDGPVTVTLRRPVPLETALAVERGDGESVRVLHDGTLIAEAASSPGPAVLKVPDPVSLAEARTAAGGARYFQDSFFPDCFVCGISRRLGDGLRIFPGPVPGRALWAAPWTPNPSVAGPDGKVRPEVVWAALDCPGGIAVAEEAGLNQDTAVVLGRMTASLAELPAVGDPCVLIAWAGGGDGRKLTAGSALLGLGGEVLAVAWAVWLTVPRPVPALCGEGPRGEEQRGGGAS
jgi:hypothetical protein